MGDHARSPGAVGLFIERRAFTIFAFQRIHVASQRGVARLIRAHDPEARASYHRAVFLN